jgi:CheY-like chemotaxis protein/chemotaxis signal transduction protein
MVSERLRDVSAQIETGFEAAALPSGPGSVSGSISTMTTMTNLSAAPDQINRSGWAPAGGGRSSQGFHELELDRYTEFHQLTRGLGEGVSDIVTLTHEMVSVLRECQASFARESRLSSDFQERLLKARLVPLQSLVPRLYRAARASALREGKEIKFFADGTDTEVDRKVFEEVVGPLLHLVRNAVNHGIERPQDRELAGKPPVGQIVVSAAYEGNQVVISVRDDGAGIDPQHIRNTAVARGWIDSYSQLSEREAINLIFQPGITTAESLTEEAGRGVGLDVVRDAVTRLRGTIEVESAVGQGTVFTMKLPISLQIARAVLVKVKNQTLAIPMTVVDQIGRLDYYQTVALPVPAIELRGERYPLAHLASYLRLQPDPVQERSSVLLVNAGNRRIGLLVDSVLVQQEIVAKPLGPHLRDVRGVAGASVLGNGQVVVILELHELLAQQPPDPVVLPSRTEGGSARVDAYSSSDEIERLAGYPAAPNRPFNPGTSQPQGGPPPAPTATGPAPFVVSNPIPAITAPHRVSVASSGNSAYVLVVDDSPSVRRVVSNMLKASNWDVQTARDGVEALEVIARQEPAAVLLDIEMPRMDGYELMATLRSQEQYRHLPLIVLTSRAATKHHQRAFQLGADAYLVKPYQDEELLSTLARLIKQAN